MNRLISVSCGTRDAPKRTGRTTYGPKPRQYQREDLRYASDMTDAEWALIEPHLPAAKRLGRPRSVPLRAIVEALLYLLRTATPWRLLAARFPKAFDGTALLLRWRL